jgi:predicted phosphodiesterase
MKRNKVSEKKVTAILTADWHLREDTPICRTDNFWEAQWGKIKFIREMQEKYDCLVVHAGDLFEHWKPSPYLLSCCFKYLPKQFYTILGNHDLPYHGVKNADKSGVYTLLAGSRITLLSGTHWGQMPKGGSFSIPEVNRKILVWHVMTYQGKLPWPGCRDASANKLLKQYSQFDLVLTGHNHQTFVEELDGRLLVNPGSLTRHKIDQVLHKPSVFLYYAKTNTAKQIFLPIEKEMMSREHVAVKERRDARIDAFVKKLDTEWQKGVSFETNLEQFLSQNKVEKQVVEIIEKAIETQK